MTRTSPLLLQADSIKSNWTTSSGIRAAVLSVLFGGVGLGWASQKIPTSSSSVYPAQENAIVFSHAPHHQIECVSCHSDILNRTKPGPLVMPGHSNCGRCHQSVLEKRNGCSWCHRGNPRAEERGESFLKFSHSLHVEADKNCGLCHGISAESSNLGLMPSADICENCHADWLNQNRCDACHWAGKDGRLILDLPRGGKLKPSGGHGGDAHDPGWENRHRQSARRQNQRCRSCHQNRDCDACHRGVLRPFNIHPPDWELSHPGAARAGLSDCQSCHRSQSKCLGCHQQTGVAESSLNRSKKSRVHPSGYGNGEHAADAKRNLVACSSCHQEADCIRCHGAEGLGRGISPHPVGFSRRCRLLKERNSRPCLKCHREADLEVKCP